MAATHDVSAEGRRAALKQAAAFAPRVQANSGEGSALLGKETYERLLGALQVPKLPLGTASIVKQ